MAKKLRCGVCGAVRPEKACHVITLTDEEKQVLSVNGDPVPNALNYCKPCWKTLSDPVSAPALMKGLLQVGLRQFGVSNAESIAKKYHARLVAKIPSNRPS